MPELKYLFEAEYADGETIVQPDDNVSRLQPEFDKDGWRPSAFYDVQEKAKQVDLVRFSLIGEGHRYSVDLQDGHFEIDGLPFQAHPQGLHVYHTAENPLRLIFFRETTRHTTLDLTANQRGDYEISGLEHSDPVVSRYIIGWQTLTDKGENIQQTIAVE